MKPSHYLDYANVRELIRSLPRPASNVERLVEWIDTGEQFGVARSEGGGIELFLAGARITPESFVLQMELAHDSWQRADAETLIANRLLLPSEPHFESVAAFLVVELLDNGAARDTALAFRRSEPVLELAFLRARSHQQFMLGLVGELVFLRALMRESPDRIAELLDSWFGWRRSSRDFQLGPCGVEVKTTVGYESRHHVSGLHQLEPGFSVTGKEETSLFLLSIGLADVPPDTPNEKSFSLPRLVEDICHLVNDAKNSRDLESKFVSRVVQYGSAESQGYNPLTMRGSAAFAREWQMVFCRLYDVADTRIHVPRRSDLVAFTAVDLSSLEFMINLPQQVLGDVNPVVGITSAVDSVLGRRDEIRSDFPI